jgi:hypothetical protein
MKRATERRPLTRRSQWWNIYATRISRGINHCDWKPLPNCNQNKLEKGLRMFPTFREFSEFIFDARLCVKRASRYYKTLATLEERLHKERIISLNSHEKVRLANRHHIPLASSLSLVASQRSSLDKSTNQSMPVSFVLGSSGSGKTFFALKRATTCVARESTPLRATVYLQPHGIDIATVKNPKSLVKWINMPKERLRSSIQSELDVAFGEGHVATHMGLARFIEPQNRDKLIAVALAK